MIEPAWKLGAGYKEMPFDEDEIEIVGVSIIEEGPLRFSIERLVKLVESESMIIQKINIYKDIPGIFFELLIDWKHTEALLKNYFTFTTQNDIVVSEGPYTSEIYTADPSKRLTLDGQRWESACHTWVAIPDKSNEWGVAYINDSKYGFDVENSTIGITVVRGPKCPDPSGNSYIAEERKGRPQDEIVTYADLEEHYIKYALIPFKGTWQKAGFSKFAHNFNTQPISTIITGLKESLDVNSDQEVIKIASESGDKYNFEIAAMKTPESEPDSSEKIILRLIENGREESTAVLTIPKSYAVKKVELVDILERSMDDESVLQSIKKDGNYIVECKLLFQSHDIHTILLSK